MAPQTQSRYTRYRKPRKHDRTRKRHYPKTVRGHRHTTAGKIFPLLHIKRPNQLHHVEKYLNEGPMTMMIVVTDWCIHCQNLKPHIEEAAANPLRNIQMMTVDGDMLTNFNHTVKRFNHSAPPIHVDGYPSVVLLGPKGKKITDLPPTGKAVNYAASNVAGIAADAGLIAANSLVNPPMNKKLSDIESIKVDAEPVRSNSLINRPKKPNGMPEEVTEEVTEEIVENTRISPLTNPVQTSDYKPVSFEHSTESMDDALDVGVSPTFSTNKNPGRPSNGIMIESIPKNAISPKTSVTTSMNSRMDNDNSMSEISGMDARVAKEITSLESVPASPSVSALPVLGSDIRTRQTVRGGTIIGGGRGGGLYSIMSQTAYRLAPAAVLLATASAVMKKKTRSKGFRPIKKRGTKKRS